MLKINLDTLNAIDRGVMPRFQVKLFFQVPEVYTEDDYLASVGDINASMSSVGSYSIGNGSVTLKNKDFYFSRKFTRELPVNKRIEVSISIGAQELLFAAGVIKGWKLDPTLLTLSVTSLKGSGCWIPSI